MNWFKELVNDEKGVPSSKRIIGIISGLTLCIALFINLFLDFDADATLVQAVACLSFGCLGLASVDKFSKTPASKTTQDDEAN
jgi:hypothetical protein